MRSVIILILLVTNTTYSWNTCSDEPFCNRLRNNNITSMFSLKTDYLFHDSLSVETNLWNIKDNKYFNLSISAFDTGIFRFTINDPKISRRVISEALDDAVTRAPINVSKLSHGLNISSGNNNAVIEDMPFRISIYRDSVLVLIINDQNKIVYNSEEHDKSIAIDITFRDATVAYGIPLHAERLALQSTGLGGLNPYRLFNVDHCCYDNFIQDSLYGAEPVLYGHSINRTTAVFWLNAAQTFVDISRQSNRIHSLFISESGIMDIFVLTGPTFNEAVVQYTYLTGSAPLPPYFALGYHQSRWSYMNQEDAETVVKKMNSKQFPLDAIWFDVDYMNDSKSFSWNYTAFPDPVVMQNHFASAGKKLILIIHPHFKVEKGYFIYDTAASYDYFVKYQNGTDFQAKGWPGLCSWLDFLNPNVSTYFAQLYKKGVFNDTTDIVHIWNDMNEPEVFDGFERSWPRYLIHYGNTTNREVHNMYAFTQIRATYAGLVTRYDGKKRPFILSRSHFSGSQRYAAVWTGDNNSTWSHLQISFPMCLSMAISGISFCGADVGGFAGNLTDELFQRWFQAGAWLPFFRGHSTKYVERREPYLYSEQVQTRIRNAIRHRYYYLPLWYTLFYEHEKFKRPVIRPLVYQYSNDTITYDMDNQWLVGANILVCPVTEENATQILIYFPGGANELWFDIDNNVVYYGLGFVRIPVTMDSTPVYHRGGSILVRKETHRISSMFMHSDPFSIYIFLDLKNEASGTLYIDDNESFNYRSGEYNYYNLKYNGSLLSISKIDPGADYKQGIFTIERILVYKPPTSYKEVIVNDEKKYKISYAKNNTYLMINNITLNVTKNMSIKFT